MKCSLNSKARTLGALERERERERERDTLNKKFNKNKGITLIALVITIIVLLILAGIAISMLTGENGILDRTVESKEKTVAANEEEKMKLAVLSALTEGKRKIDINDINGTKKGSLLKALAEEFGAESDIVTNYTAGKITLTNGDIYIVTENGNTKKIELISNDTSYVGYYADVDGKDGPDGVIYADLAIGTSATRKWKMD